MLFSIKIVFSCVACCLTLLAVINSPTVAMDQQTAKYRLALSFEPDNSRLVGTAHIRLEANEPLRLGIGGLRVTGIVVKQQDGIDRKIAVPNKQGILIEPADEPREVYISYNKTADISENNLISKDGIVLLSNWYPLPDRKMTYNVSAALPTGFEAITEADNFPLMKKDGGVVSTLSEPIATIHFVAAPYVIEELEVRPGLKLYTLFFAEDRHLAKEYLTAARTYVQRYEKEIGVFPYPHFAIVGNRLPTGLGMPTFTLLGQSVLRLPFIKYTSLGHEILHAYFGNAVDVDLSQGNWCEGLTSHLADHAFRRDLGEGSAYRLETLLNYQSYVDDERVIPLAEFTTGSHTQPLANSRRAVGYSKAMMLFHELETTIGRNLFQQSIRQFYARFRGKSANWQDIEGVFSEISGRDLTGWFTERLQRSDIAHISATDIAVTSSKNGSRLSFVLKQHTAEPYSLTIPITIVTAQDQQRLLQPVTEATTRVQFELPARPLEMVLDPDFSLLRRFSAAESPAAWSRFLGSVEKRVIVAESNNSIYAPLLSALKREKMQILSDEEVRNSELPKSDLLLLGDSATARSLFARVDNKQTGFTMEVRRHPLNRDRVAVLVSSNSRQETESVAQRLKHYGKYGYLHFTSGKLVDKRLPESSTGIRYAFEQLPAGGSTASLSSFATLVDELSQQDVIYVGETHTSQSDHRLQLRLIEAMAMRHPDIAIGMEMFPVSSQEALDSYVLDNTLSEKAFLKASRYYSVWNYDYRYFREIFTFARQQKIPIIGLNLNRETVSTVYSSGGTDTLSEETRQSLPADRDLSLPGYSERLYATHSLHQSKESDNDKVGGFIQAQALWDESMAKNIVDHLRLHPGRKMIVLAGSQHTRKDSGIPPRVARQLPVKQFSVLNIFNGSAPFNLPEVADYYFLVQPFQLMQPAIMGIILKEQKDGDRLQLVVEKINPGSKAEENGLEAGDILVSIDGVEISSLEDVPLAMFDGRPGDTIPVNVRRRSGNSESSHDLKIELISREPKPAGHP